MDKKTGKIVIENNKGETKEYDVLFTFDDEETKKSYIIFTDQELDKNGNIKVYANTYDPKGNKNDFDVIKTEKEWKMIENILCSLQEEKGEYKDEKK